VCTVGAELFVVQCIPCACVVLCWTGLCSVYNGADRRFHTPHQHNNTPTKPSSFALFSCFDVCLIINSSLPQHSLTPTLMCSVVWRYGFSQWVHNDTTLELLLPLVGFLKVRVHTTMIKQQQQHIIIIITDPITDSIGYPHCEWLQGASVSVGICTINLEVGC